MKLSRNCPSAPCFRHIRRRTTNIYHFRIIESYHPRHPHRLCLLRSWFPLKQNRNSPNHNHNNSSSNLRRIHRSHCIRRLRLRSRLLSPPHRPRSFFRHLPCCRCRRLWRLLMPMPMLMLMLMLQPLCLSRRSPLLIPPKRMRIRMDRGPFPPESCLEAEEQQQQQSPPQQQGR